MARRLSGRECGAAHGVQRVRQGRDDDDDAARKCWAAPTTDLTLHNVVIVQDKKRKFFPVSYDFDLSGMVHAPYAARIRGCP